MERGPERQFTVLAVDDDRNMLNLLRSRLTAARYRVLTAATGADALKQVRLEEPDLVLLDAAMPRMDGFAVLRSLRSFSAVPVFFLTAGDNDDDKIKGLNMGADECLEKPFNAEELIARIEALRRRLGTTAGQSRMLMVLYFGDIVIDFSRRGLTVAREPKHLTRTEWFLLSELARNAGRLVTYEELLTRVWGPGYREDIQVLRTWISRLRSKLKSSAYPSLIRTVPKSGYIIDQFPA